MWFGGGIRAGYKYNLIKIVEIKNVNYSSFLDYSYSFIKRKQYDLNPYEKKFKDFLFYLH